MSENPQMNVAVNPAIDENWTATITPHRGWFDWRLKQLWGYRDLISLFVWRDFVSVYKQTILGPAWHIIQPLLTTITFTMIFGWVAGDIDQRRLAFPFLSGGHGFLGVILQIM